LLRLHFSSKDLGKVVFNETLLPICEAVLSLQTLPGTDQQARFGPWRENLRGQIPAAVRPLQALVPERGWIPDFLTPVLMDAGSEASLNAIRATPGTQLRTELTRLGAASRLPGWVRLLAGGDADTMSAVADALYAWNRLAITPYESRMQAALDADRAHKTALMTQQGLDSLLRRLHPTVAWQPPVLTLPSSTDTDIELAGRGLCLTPMVFCGPLPRLRFGDDIGSMPALAYPLSFDLVAANPLAVGGTKRKARDVAALDRLLGGTRSTILRTIANSPGLTTAGLAHRTNVALATASEHATVLREAGLITTHRDGPRVRHHPTATAAALLDIRS
jgi:DNA-binding transcriptional ArsR family regulator